MKELRELNINKALEDIPMVYMGVSKEESLYSYNDLSYLVENSNNYGIKINSNSLFYDDDDYLW